MGIFFTLFYVFTAYVGTPILFGALAQDHIEIIIAMFALICSLPYLPNSDILKIPQTYGVLGLCLAVGLSMVFSGWAGGAVAALTDFIPNAMLFFFVVLSFRKKGHLQLLVGVLLMAALWTIFRGYLAQAAGDASSVYVITMKTGTGEVLFRVRGVTFLNDPNDFAQFMAGLIPCMFLFWNKGKYLRNLVMVIVPVGVLIFGMYLTHSRGGMIALMVVAAVAGRRKLGILPSVIGGGLLFAGLSLAGFSGGREVSMESGADRMDAWAAGLQMIRTHPLFGIGYKRFTDFHQLTAHNTVVLCAAELGFFGLFFWMFLTVPTVRDALAGSGPLKLKAARKSEEEGSETAPVAVTDIASSRHRPASAFVRRAQAKVAANMLRGPVLVGGSSLAVPATAFAAPVAETSKGSPSAAPYGYTELDPDAALNKLSDTEIRNLCNIMLVALSGFLTAGWFLSRAYTMSLFLYAGMTAVVYRMARKRGIAPPPMTMFRTSRVAVIACVITVTLVWIILRADHLLPH